METRPLSSADLPDWVELVAACAKADDTGQHYSSEDLAEELEAPGLEPARDTIAVLRGGRLAGYATLAVRQTTEPVFRIGLDAAVHPEQRGRGVGTELITWAIRVAEGRRRPRHRIGR